MGSKWCGRLFRLLIWFLHDDTICWKIRTVHAAVPRSPVRMLALWLCTLLTLWVIFWLTWWAVCFLFETNRWQFDFHTDCYTDWLYSPTWLENISVRSSPWPRPGRPGTVFREVWASQTTAPVSVSCSSYGLGEEEISWWVEVKDSKKKLMQQEGD